MKKVLIIEDDLDILEAIKLTLQMNGFEVAVAVQGKEGIAQANKYLPDLIILDYLLAGSNGGVICQTLKSATATKHIPIIVASAHPSAHMVVANNGADDYIAKPFSIFDLLQKVSDRINQSSVSNCN